MNVQHLQVASNSDAVESLGMLIAQALAVAPDRCAFRFQNAELTRGDIHTEANAFAGQLHQIGVVAGEPITIEVEHSFELIVCMLGVLMAGGCVVPIDPSLPEKRKAAIQSDVGARLRVAPNAAREIDITVGDEPHQPSSYGRQSTRLCEVWIWSMIVRKGTVLDGAE